MGKKTEVLKKIIHFSKKHKMPKKLVIIELAFVLLCFYLFYGLKTIIRMLFKGIFPNKRVTAAYILLGCILCMITIPKSENNLDDEIVYGDVINTDVESGTLNSSNTELYNDETINKSTEADTQNQQNNESDKDSNHENNDTETNGDYEPKVYSDEELLNMSFYIKVNRLMNCITIYTQDESGNYVVPIKAMSCSTGGENTPLGIFSTSQKYAFRKLLFGVYGQYATRVVDQILFHSSSYSENKKNKLIPEEYNRLGEGISHGCIRLTVADAKWIYDYCKEGTTVEIYEDSIPGPLGKPETITIPEHTEWDPTDPDEKNPWKERMPQIEGTQDQSIIAGQSIDLMNGVTALDTCGNDITNQIHIQSNIDYSIPGDYEVIYQVTDLLGKSTSKTIQLTIN